MPKIKPNSTVTLYKSIPITDGQQIVFGSRAAQRSYFNKNVLAARVDCSYIKRNGTIRLQYTTSVVSQANYISFTNPAFENKTFYARITDYDYINNVTTEIRYDIDYFQSFMFDVQYFDGLIEREHMTESDWQLVDANPFRNDVYELLTAEDLTMSKDLLKISQITDTNREVQIPEFGNNRMVMLVAQWAEGDDLTEWKNIITSNTRYAVFADGTTWGFNDLEWIPNVRVPNPVDVLAIAGDSAQEQKVNMNNILTFLTVKLVTMEILGIYYIGEDFIKSWMAHKIEGADDNIVNIDIQPYTGYVNKKLCRFPYQYLQCVTNDDVKEYQYERFTADKKFTYLLSLDSAPVVSIIPYQYNENYVSINEKFKYNLKERIDVDSIPQIAYTTDAYLSYVSESLAGKLSEKQTYETDLISQGVSPLDYSGTFSNVFKSIGSGMKSSLQRAGGNLEGSLATEMEDYNRLRHTDVSLLDEYMRGGVNLEGDYISDVYGNSKPLYAADQYVPGSSSYTSCYIGQTTTVGAFYFVNRRINSEVGKIYDAYLSAYGNKSMRYGTPHVCDYITGGENAPHFINGSTYCKTQNMHVISDMKMASDYIEAVFNSGHKFLKGEDL